jgi:hypothetical protein
VGAAATSAPRLPIHFARQGIRAVQRATRERPSARTASLTIRAARDPTHRTRTPPMIRTLRSLATPFLLVVASSLAAAHDVDYFTISLDGAQSVPPVPTAASGQGCAVLDLQSHELSVYFEFGGLSSLPLGAHVHGFAAPGAQAPALFDLGLANPASATVTLTAAQALQFQSSLAYVSVSSALFPSGEIRGQIVRQPPTPIANYCAGDGSGSACPCGNGVSPGVAAGCRNSSGAGAFLRAEGAPSVHCESFGLAVGGLPGSGSVLFFQGTTRENGGAGTVFGDGLRCVTGTVVRLGVLMASGGEAELDAPGGAGGVAVGDTRYYQAWYRNSVPFCAPAGFNFTDALEITWIH